MQRHTYAQGVDRRYRPQSQRIAAELQTASGAFDATSGTDTCWQELRSPP